MIILVRKIMQDALIRRSVYTLPSYEETLKTLYSLQSNAASLQLTRKQTAVGTNHKCIATEKYLARSGITPKKLKTLSLIHVAGSKGKGSTCAFTEAILRKHGFKTGFFSSPHLVSVKERIRINGEPISESKFVHYFWKVYKKLDAMKEHETDMPIFFGFMTVLMFNVFLEENIDVGIIEVGIGGENDSTNVIQNPVCVGISSLALEHTCVLGNSLEEIAYQKSGIMKPNAAVFTVPQPAHAMRVLEKRAEEKNCILQVIPPFNNYFWENLSPFSGLTNHVKQQNASLAMQLAIQWMKLNPSGENPCIMDYKNETYSIYSKEAAHVTMSSQHLEFPKSVSMDKIASALCSCKWPGRMQILRGTVADFFLDGAHTAESIECCVSWFKDASSSNNGTRILIFNMSGERNASELMMPLKSLNFHRAYFVPNYGGIGNVDDATHSLELEKQKITCKRNSESWGTGSALANSISEVLEAIKKYTDETVDNRNRGRPLVLVAGSLHLVGAVLSILDPHLTMTTKF